MGCFDTHNLWWKIFHIYCSIDPNFFAVLFGKSSGVNPSVKEGENKQMKLK